MNYGMLWRALRTAEWPFFGDRARAELAACGVRLSRTEPKGDVQLTPQEEQVADLAIQVGTKAEIAARLYLSVHTVDYHLRKVYRKLGVNSRSELARAHRRIDGGNSGPPLDTR
jgi:DNA-binding CsgD family transcriptional regulator